VTATHWKIHKFGGSSLADAECFRRVAKIVCDNYRTSPEFNLGIVVSAMGGMTDKLLRIAALAEGNAAEAESELQSLGDRYTRCARDLLDAAALVPILDSWSADAETIRQLISQIADARSASPRHRDVLAGFGELWSTRLLAAFLANELGSETAGHWIDARDVLVIRHGDLGPLVLWGGSRKKLGQVLPATFSGITVITGFIASDEDGTQTTLGRNGSDHSAAIFAALTKADELTIWTDVDGVLSGDPRRIPEAQIISSLTYNEAMELAYFGAKVIHPQTMGPAVANNIPILIRNTFAPGHPGSRIGAVAEDGAAIKGITAVEGMALVNLEGAGMIGVPGTADRLFAALKAAGVSVTLISQASSEHSICIAVPQALASRARQVIGDAFADELASGQIQSIDVTDGQSIVAVVGDGMAGTPGVAGRFFGTLGRAGINIRAIAQGSSERNISAVVDTADVTRALRAVHSGFYLSAKTVSIGLIGPGSVGSELLDQIKSRCDWLRDRFNLDLRVRAIARSGKMLLGDRQVDLGDWRSAIETGGIRTDLAAFERHVHADHLPHAAIIDCTSSEDIAGMYAGWLRKGIHVITPNKKAFSGRLEYYRELGASARKGNSHYFYETTVGAALPIVSTLRNLIDTGDRVRSIKGILSGTLAYLFNLYDGSQPFSEIVRVARQNGYTEPDPRDDLSGMDVARKLTILARELGYNLEIGEFPVENLIPEALRDLGTDEFMKRLPEYDDAMDKRYRDARNRGNNLRYVAMLDENGKASVALTEVSADDAFSHVRLTDNIVQFASDRYSANPLVVQGPGAGPQLTAAGVFGDLLSLANYLGGTD